MSRKTAKAESDQIHIGVFPIGCENADVYVLPLEQEYGCFYLCPDDASLPRIKIAIGSKHWVNVVGIALHESFEFLTARLLCRYQKSGVIGDHASYLFSFNHCQFSDLCQRQAIFIAQLLPALSEAYRKHGGGKK